MSFGVLSVLGLAVFGGLAGAVLFQKIRFPQVVGYIIIGLLIGGTGFRIVSPADVETLKPLNMFALGIIGFLVGGELKLSTFRKYAKQFTWILMMEGCAAFLLVGAAVFAVTFFLTKEFNLSLATGIIFGAIASATDPASTMDVIWEYRAAGPVTTATIAVIALDDALAMTLYGVGTGFSKMLTSGDSSGILRSLGQVFSELGFSLFAGLLMTLVLLLFLKLIRQLERAVALSVGVILLTTGIAIYCKLDVILASMAMGFLLVNVIPQRSEAILAMLRSFAIPVYVLFFVLVGAKIDVSMMPGWLWWIVLLYVLFRNAGKIAGCYWGAKISGAPAAVCKYMGLGLFAQGGVAIGLSIVAGEYLTGIQLADGLKLSDMIVYVVTATTLVFQLSGPPMVKLALKLSKEAGKNVTEEDVMEKLTVKDILPEPAAPCSEGDSVEKAVDYFTDSDSAICPVVDKSGRVSGLLSFESLKAVLGEREIWNWILVTDVMEPMHEFLTLDTPLLEAREKLNQLQADALPVIDGNETLKPMGILTRQDIAREVRARLLAADLCG